MEAVADFVLDREILRRRIDLALGLARPGLGFRSGGWQRQRDRRQRGEPNQQRPELFGHGLLPGPRASDRNATITPQNRICPMQLRIAITRRLRWITADAHSARLRQSRPMEDPR